MRHHFSKEKLLGCIPVLLFIMTPLLSAALFCLRDGRMISDVYIPLSGWSDEIMYYKQIEGILSHGMPRGYFGWNQSQALYGSLSTWGLIPLIPYVMWGKLLGWNYCSPIYANIAFCMLGLWVLWKSFRLSRKEMAVISLFWFTNPFLNRYVLSGTVEASVTLQLIVVTVCGGYLLSEKIRQRHGEMLSAKKDRLIMVLCTFLICLLTLARPYFAVLFLIPFWKSVRDRQKWWIVGLPVLSLVTMALFFINSHYFCAPYYATVVSFEKIRSSGMAGLFTNLLQGLGSIAHMIWYALRYHDLVGWYYLILFMELACMAFVCARQVIQHTPPNRMFLITLTGNSLILLSLIEMYDLNVGARHILPLTVANAALLIAEAHVSLDAVLSAVCLAATVLTMKGDALPYQNHVYAAYMDALKEQLAEAVKVTDEISYDNVVAMPTASQTGTYYGLLFAMPAGVGLSADHLELYENPQNIKAKYILVHPEASLRTTLETWGMSCIYENHEMALYARTP